MHQAPAGASIIVPTYREAPNIEPLVRRVFAALAPTGRDAELIIVDDDSRDGTADIAARLASEFPVRIIVRSGERGLSTAVLAGFQAARSDRFVVMDADLQHPPEAIPAMLDRLDAGGCDFVLGTRYAEGGALAEQWGLWRRLASRTATMFARPLAPISDPMSGFFALRRSTWEQAAPLNPLGYKIALELYVKGRCRRPAEVPIQFATRAAGESKFNLTEVVRFLRHVYRLYRFRFPVATPVLTIIAGSLVVALAALAILALVR